MTPESAPNASIDPGESPETVQLLVADAGNRSAISGMLDEQFDVETSQTVTDADLYLIEDHLFPEYRAALRERVEREHPAFCPVVLIRRESTNLGPEGVDPSASEEGVRYDEVIDAPIDPPQLIRRLNSLLVRRQQSLELQQQVSTLEERDQRLRLFEQGVESTGNGVVMTDPAGTIEYVNPALESIAGYTEEDVLGESPQILLPEGTGEVFDDEFWRTMTDQAEWEGDIIIEGKDSHRLVVNATATALRDAEDETQGFVIVLSDITERIQREQDLEDREVELDLLRQILTRYLRHNLRNDLNVIKGSAELLKEDETLSPTQIELAETIIDNSEDLLEMSDTARTYSSLIERDAELSPFDLSEITRNAVQNVRESFPDVDFEIDAPETCEIRAREGIQRAFEELIDNAARYNDGANPWVRIQVRDREGGRLVIEDNGPGIPAQERDSLERGAETQLSHSQGVGLWLSKWVIEGVDGRLSIELTDTGTRAIADFPSTATVGSSALEITTLKEREQRLQTITDRMTDAIIKVDADWNVTTLDGPAEEMLNIDADTVVDRSLWAVFSNLRDTQFETVVQNTMESRSSTSFEQYFERIDAWLEVNVYPEFDGGLSFYTKDITERKEREKALQETKQRLKTIIELSPEPVVALDSSGTVSLWNKAAEDVFGHTSEEAIGERVQSLELFGEGQFSRFKERFERVLAGETIRGLEVEHQRKDGTTLDLTISATPIQDISDGETGMLAIAQDITELKERERDLQERVKELSAIHDATNLFQTLDAPMEALLSEFVESIPQSFQYPDITEARLRYDGIAVSTAEFESRDHVLTAHADLEDGSTLELDVGVSSDSRIGDDNPFLAEEEELLDTLFTVVKNHLQRRTHLRDLERTEDLLTNAERLGDVGAWEVDLETPDVFWTDGTRRIYGVSEEFELTPETAEEFFHPEDRDTVTNAISTCAESGDSFALEVRIQTKDGDERWVHIEGEPLDTGGEMDRVRGYIQDITERKEQNLRYDAIFNQTFQFAGLLEPDGTIIEANDTALEFSGVTREDVLGEKLWNSPWFEISEETQQQTKADVERASTGEFVRRELEIQGANSTLMVDFSIRPVTDDNGSIVLLVPEARDISELKQREKELQRESARFKAVFENSFDPMILADDDGRYIEVNESATEMFGVSEDELLGRSIAEFAPEDFDFAEAWEQFQASEEERGTFPLVRPDGEERIVEYAATRDIVPGQHLSILRDITERDTEERKREQIIDRVTDAIVEVDSDWRFTLVNEKAEDLYGMDEEYLLGRNFWSVFEAAKETTFEEKYRGVMETREPTSFVGYFSQLDGWFDIKAYPKDDGGIEFYFVEVTEHYKRERELAEKTRQLEAIVQNTEEAIYIKDIAGYYQFINESGAELFDLSPEEVVGKHDKDLFDEESVADIRSEDEKVMESGQAVRRETVRYIDGEKHVFLSAKYPYRDEDGEVIGLIGISPDITERKEHEWELRRQNERLEEFTSVVSHDLRNPLNVAQGRIELAQEECDSEHLDAAADGVERSFKLIEDLLALATGGKAIGEMEPVEVTDLVQTCWNHVETGDATVVADFESTIQADGSRLRQLLENLFRNAVEHGSEDVTIRIGSLPDGFYVEDDGPGIPKEERDDVFDVGYSMSDEGTGFGLSIVKQIAEAHDWNIRVTESKDGGARFEITGVEFTAE